MKASRTLCRNRVRNWLASLAVFLILMSIVPVLLPSLPYAWQISANFNNRRVLTYVFFTCSFPFYILGLLHALVLPPILPTVVLYIEKG